MKALIDLINTKYHPQTQTFFQVRAQELIQQSGMTLDEIDEKWEEIEMALEQNNLFMLPALPDAGEDETVRIFRRDSSLGRVLLEALFPTLQGNSLMTRAISALNHPPQGRNHNGPKPRDNRQHQGYQGRNHQSHQGRNHQNRIITPDATQPSSRGHYTRPLE